MEENEEAKRMEELLERTIDIDTITGEERERLAQDFPGGNFLYHGANTDGVIGIMHSGSILNYSGLLQREKRAADAEGRPTRSLMRNSGYEGISWSMNEIDALPGTRYHLAGFIASPNTVLREGQQLAVPSRPAPQEVIQISGDIDSNKFYELKVQGELYQTRGIGEPNSVEANLVSMMTHLQKEEAGTAADPSQLVEFFRSHSDEEIDQLLDGSYGLRDDGTVILDSKLYQQSGNQTIPAGAAWLQGIIASGRIHNVTEFADCTNLREIVSRANAKNIGNFADELKKDTRRIDEEADPEILKVSELGADVSDMYLVAPRKDLPSWLRVMARSAHQPKGILVYDGKKVRLENFARSYTGDAGALTDELKQAIEPSEGYIDWEDDVLGEEVTADKRAGNNNQVVAERYLSKRKTIRNEGGELVVS